EEAVKVASTERKKEEEAKVIPAPNKTPDSAPAPWDLLARKATQDKPAAAAPDEKLYGTRDRKEDHFTPHDYRVALFLRTRDLVNENHRQEVLDKLSRSSAQHVDLYCRQAQTALDRLESAFKDQGIRFIMAPDAENFYKLHLRTDYVLYAENIASEEVLALLQHVANQDRKA